MTNYVALKNGTLVARTNGNVATLYRGAPVPEDAVQASIDHLLAIGYIEEGGPFGGTDSDGAAPAGPRPSSAIPIPAEADAGKAIRVNDAGTAYELGSPAATNVLPIANPAGGTVVDFDSPIGEDGSIKVVQMFAPPEGFQAPSVFAFQVEGDDAPRVIWNSNTATVGLCMGDGTEDPSNQAQITVANDGQLTVWSKRSVKLLTGFIQLVGDSSPNWLSIELLIISDATFDAGVGPVLTAPDASLHRIVVANDGTLSTEAV